MKSLSLYSMYNANKIKECYDRAKNYADLAHRLQLIGVESYTVDTVTSTILYRFEHGENELVCGSAHRQIASSFDIVKTIEAVRNNQQGKTDYVDFMNEIASAGVRFYEATFSGPNKRVTYIGTGGSHEESIPWPKFNGVL